MIWFGLRNQFARTIFNFVVSKLIRRTLTLMTYLMVIAFTLRGVSNRQISTKIHQIFVWGSTDGRNPLFNSIHHSANRNAIKSPSRSHKPSAPVWHANHRARPLAQPMPGLIIVINRAEFMSKSCLILYTRNIALALDWSTRLMPDDDGMRSSER